MATNQELRAAARARLSEYGPVVILRRSDEEERQAGRGPSASDAGPAPESSR